MALESHQLNYNGIIWKDAVLTVPLLASLFRLTSTHWQQD